VHIASLWASVSAESILRVVQQRKFKPRRMSQVLRLQIRELRGPFDRQKVSAAFVRAGNQLDDRSWIRLVRSHFRRGSQDCTHTLAEPTLSLSSSCGSLEPTTSELVSPCSKVIPLSSDTSVWRITLGLGVVPPMILLFFRVFMKEVGLLYIRHSKLTTSSPKATSSTVWPRCRSREFTV
jgi:hypothetical protein